MPLDEEGAKWSCEPCIRGHRSSKCQHFDRLMMKVPKAGRPLAKCPHPKGTCSCQKTYAFMVRIPKGSSCLCRPLYKIPMVPEDGQPSSTSSPPAPSPAPGKVQKSNRRQSNLQAAPENIARALDFTPDFANQQIHNGISAPGTPYSFNYPEFASSSGTPTTNNKHPMILPKQSSETNVQTIAPQPSCCSKEQQPLPLVEKKGSCCGGTVPEATEEPKPKSCCSSKPKAAPPGTDSGNPFPPWHQFPSGNHLLHQNLQFSPPYIQSPVYMNGYHVPNSAAANPVSFVPSTMQWSNTFGPSMQQSFAGSVPYGNMAPPAVLDASKHECSCGDDCQCLGCASHPFNNTTRQHIQEMGYMMTIGEEGQSPDGLDGSRQSPVSGTMSPTLFGYPETAEGTTSLAGGCCGKAAQNVPEQGHPSHFDYGLSAQNSSHYDAGQHLMQPSEYYEVEYPVPLPGSCSDMTGTCQCGNDCSCVGCLTHSGHNGMPLEAPPENTHAGMEDRSASQRSPTHPEPRFAALDEFSLSSLSPPAVEPQLV
ncbi:hypothetical protein DTO021D3_6366 [Paecilomyces variotii]|nr:hypothetical protein DTO032I3_3734 [Paecilomyces variotii]KAJ9276761.1 hypothetical protein DTO021D3_6366 [Paecilomyces variotii]KAJ9345735.1 hypothetical protein DTO027B6_1695 [Paecilomyces variotii]KAJ9387417.1 hypothetical protein DTO032I4_3281 [Paecilomyces variotii]